MDQSFVNELVHAIFQKKADNGDLQQYCEFLFLFNSSLYSKVYWPNCPTTSTFSRRRTRSPKDIP